MEQGRKQGYEPDRIPPSVFATTMTPKQEWSTQSNDLFSIHMGDQSFTKMYKSEELSNFDYTINNNNTTDNKSNLNHAGTKELNNVSKPDQPQQCQLSPTKSYRSDTSNNSAASFAFPILPESQQDPKTSLKEEDESGKTDISRPDPTPSSHSDDPNPGNGGGWLSCLSCFSVKS